MSSTVVLRKRRHSTVELEDSLVLHLSSSPSPSYYDPEGSEYDIPVPDCNIPGCSQGARNPKSRTVKRYKCSYAACMKAYSKPSRLAEHERSHTGDVSVCYSFDSCYLHMGSDPSFAPVVTRATCVNRTSKPTPVHIFPVPLGHFCAMRISVERGSGLCNIFACIVNSIREKNRLKWVPFTPSYFSSIDMGYVVFTPKL